MPDHVMITCNFSKLNQRYHEFSKCFFYNKVPVYMNNCYIIMMLVAHSILLLLCICISQIFNVVVSNSGCPACSSEEKCRKPSNLYKGRLDNNAS